MTKEVKVILDYLKSKYDIVDELGNDYKKVKFKDCKLLLDYITNLQEENERLNTELNGYKSRCEKAIEHIKEHQLIYTSQYEEESNFDNHLLDILNGGNE